MCVCVCMCVCMCMGARARKSNHDFYHACISHNLCCSGKLSVEAIQVVCEELRKKGELMQALMSR